MNGDQRAVLAAVIAWLIVRIVAVLPGRGVQVGTVTASTHTNRKSLDAGARLATPAGPGTGRAGVHPALRADRGAA